MTKTLRNRQTIATIWPESETSDKASTPDPMRWNAAEVMTEEAN